MTGKSKFLILATTLTAAVSLAVGAIVVKGVETVNQVFTTNEVKASITFNKANWVQESLGNGWYAQKTTARTENGTKVVMYNEYYNMSGSAGIATLRSSTANITFWNEDHTSEFYFQQIDSMEMTFTSTSVGYFQIVGFTEDGGSDDQWIDIDEGGILHEGTVINVNGFRKFLLGNAVSYNDYHPIELTSLTLNYTCISTYDDKMYGPYDEVNVVVSNDFHGYVEETDENLGLKKFGTYFKERGEEPNTLTLDQGDSWQGTAYSNMNRGALVNNVMAYAGFNARTVGNHDFDWGVDALKANTARVFTHEGKDYTVPTLAANVYDYDFVHKQFGTTQQAEIGGKTLTYTLENGLKVGIIGVIGEDQITSINSEYTQTIGFKEHTPIIKSLATELKENEHCDLIILSIHADQDAVKNQGLENFVNLVLCGHSHEREYRYENGLLFIQCGSNGKTFGDVKIMVNQETGVITNRFKFVVAEELKARYTEQTIDPVIKKLVDDEIERCDLEGQEILATGTVGTFISNHQAANLMAKAIYDYAKEVNGINDLDFTYVNQSRSNLNEGTWTYANVYQAFPFDNVVYVTEITGKEIHDEVEAYNWVYFNPSFSKQIDMKAKYKVAMLDYLYLHNNSSRYYDYFPTSAGTSNVKLTKTVGENQVPINYREIFKWWLQHNEFEKDANHLDASDYVTFLPQHQKAFTYQTYTVTYHYNYEGSPTEGIYHSIGLVSYGTSLSGLYSDPQRDGYTFGGWYLDAACTQSAPATVTSDLNLYAKWVDPNQKGSSTNPFTVSEAIDHIDAVIAEGTYTNGNDGIEYHVIGTITGNVQPGNNNKYKFDITDGERNFTIYYATCSSTPLTGQTVVIRSQILYYANGGIYETKSNAGVLVRVVS